MPPPLLINFPPPLAFVISLNLTSLCAFVPNIKTRSMSPIVHQENPSYLLQITQFIWKHGFQSERDIEQEASLISTDYNRKGNISPCFIPTLARSVVSFCFSEKDFISAPALQSWQPDVIYKASVQLGLYRLNI